MRAWKSQIHAGYDYADVTLALHALLRGAALGGVVDWIPLRDGPRHGAEVDARADGEGRWVIRVGGTEWYRGDAYDCAAEWVAIVGFNLASILAAEALEALSPRALESARAMAYGADPTHDEPPGTDA